MSSRLDELTAAGRRSPAGERRKERRRSASPEFRRSPPPSRNTGCFDEQERRDSRERSHNDRSRREPREGRDDRERRDNNRGGGRDSSRRQGESSSSAGAPTGGDGGWGNRSKPNLSPGRPSLSLPSQHSLTTRNGDSNDSEGGPKPVAVIEPNFAPSGALAAETNTFQGVVLKYNEPPEARKPVRLWRLYVFKGKEQVELFHVHRQSAYLLGRDRIVADIPIDHPSTSKQHAVLQYRQAIERSQFGETKSMTKPYIIDLDSANGTLVNDEMIPKQRYYELKSGDVLKFAFSTREYVLLAET